MKTWVGLLALAALCATTAAVAADAPNAGNAKPEAAGMPMPGPESKALAKFFGQSLSWSGKAEAGAMGPDFKETTTHGKAVCHTILGGWWYAMDLEDTYGSGKAAMTWRGHQLVGYDPGTKSYRAAMVDNTGTLTTWSGTLDGDTFVLETPEPVMLMGQMLKDRFTFARNADGTFTFKDEHQAVGADWQLVESGTLRPMSGAKARGEHVADGESSK